MAPYAMRIPVSSTAFRPSVCVMLPLIFLRSLIGTKTQVLIQNTNLEVQGTVKTTSSPLTSFKGIALCLLSQNHAAINKW